MSEATKFRIGLHSWIEAQQTLHGVRHEDFNQYQSYCSRRISRLRHHSSVKKELVHSTKYVSNTKGRPRHAYCARKSDAATYELDEAIEAKENQAETEEADTPLTEVPHENFLWVLLVSAERAWAHACSLQRSSKRCRSHILRRLAKAKQFASRLEACAKINADEITYKECQAYTGWMKGSWALEKGEFKAASLEFAKAITLCHELAESATHGSDDGGENLDDPGSLERKDLFAERAETVLRPLFRYCQYELKEAGEATVEEPALFSDNASPGVATSSEDAIFFRGQEIHIDNKELHVLMLKLQSLAAAGGGSNTKETTFLQTLSTLDDALSLVQSSFQSLEKSKAGPAINAKRQQLDMWKGYLQSKKIHLVMDHTESLLDDISDHGERVHVYSTLLKHAQDLLLLPHPKGEDGEEEEEDEFALQAQANVLRIKALKCYHMGMYYYRDRDEYAEALALLEHSAVLTKRAMEEIAACDEDMPHAEEYLSELEKLQDVSLLGAKISVEAAWFGDAYQDDIGAAPKNKPMKTSRPLLQRLDDWDAGEVLADDPPMFMPIPCKPVFYDLAWDYASNLSKPVDVVERFIEENTVPEEPEPAESSGGIFSWFSSK